jgi:hypothetical protein
MTNAPLLARIVDEEAFPTAARVGAAAGAAHGGAYSAERAWEFGLERVLDGPEALIDRSTSEALALKTPTGGDVTDARSARRRRRARTCPTTAA